MKLTQFEEDVYNLRHSQSPPLSYREVAKQLGVTKDSISAAYHRAVKKKTTPEPEEKLNSSPKALEVRDPEKAAGVIDALTDPLHASIVAVARECGVSRRVADLLAQRLETRFQPLKRTVENVKTLELLSLTAHTPVEGHPDCPASQPRVPS